MTKSITLYFGPVRKVPSWRWVGADVAEHIALSHHYQVRFFDDAEDIAAGSIVFWVKCPAGNQGSDVITRKNLQVIFFPVDAYTTHQSVSQNAAFIDACKIVALHAGGMTKYFPEDRVRYIDHYNKYGIEPDRRNPVEGLLWVGAYQYYPYIFRYMLEHQITGGNSVKILTDLNNRNAIQAANVLGKRLGLEVDFSTLPKNSDVTLIEWSEPRQQSLMISCLGAFDYKDPADFNQINKPPTKMQKYLCSQIPCAINHDSPLKDSLGFNVCDPSDIHQWLSASYRRRVAEYGAHLTETLSLDAIALAYLRFADELS